MSPSPKKTRSVRRTALIHCEGANDSTFIQHLVNLYSQAGRIHTHIRLRRGKGGSPDILVIESINVIGLFDKRMVKADKDRPATEIRAAEKIATQNNITIVWSKPCLEALLLSILDGKSYQNYQSKTCKQKFESTYIPTDKRNDVRSYVKHFDLPKIESARKRIPELDQIITFITS